MRHSFKRHLLKEFSIENYLFFYDTRHFKANAERLGVGMVPATAGTGPRSNRRSNATCCEEFHTAEDVKRAALRIYYAYIGHNALNEVRSIFLERHLDCLSVLVVDRLSDEMPTF